MRIKNHLTILLMLVMFCGILGCGDKNPTPDGDYIYLPQTKQQTRNDEYQERIYKYEYKYDSYGNIIKEEYYRKGSIFYARETCIDTTYTYDENGKILEEYIRDEGFTTMITDGSYCYEYNYRYTYDEKGFLVRKDEFNSSTADEFLDAFRYEYDDNGNRIREIRCNSDGTEQTEYEYEYDLNNRLIKKIEVFNSPGCTITYSTSEIEYTYDDYGKLIYSKHTFYDEWGTVVSHYIETVYHYDELNRLVKEESVLIRASGEKTVKEVIEYENFIKISKRK